MIKDFEPRLYQQTIFGKAVKYNTLVVLPTGMGKTNIFLMLAAQRLKQYPDSKILFLGPTRPLIEQYKSVFLKHFEIEPDKIVILTGQVKPEKRLEMFSNAQIILSTPQGLENDIISSKINLKDVSLLGFDEAHKAVGDYSYVWIAKQYNRTGAHPRILGLTASPGSDLATITEICSNLFIEAIEVRTDVDQDVKPYIKEIKMDWVKVELPDNFIEIKKNLDECIKSKFDEMKKYGYVTGDRSSYSKKELLGMQAGLQAEIAQGNKDFNVLKSLSLIAEVMKVQHAQELLETQGIEPLHVYLEGIMNQARTSKVKAVQNLTKDINFRSALLKTATLFEDKILHPKMKELTNIVKAKAANKQKIIVFNQYRDNAVTIVDELNKVPKVTCKLFVGQAKKRNTGLSQKEQKQIIKEFREDEFNVICMTSVGEEGLDIPKVDTVIFYEPIPSTIRHIQRRGRTGRLEKGEVIILMAKNTRDEAYRWSAHHKERRMYKTLSTLKNQVAGLLEKNQSTISDYTTTGL